MLLDTNALIWLVGGDQRLGPAAKRSADEALAEGSLFVSAISFWEVALLVSRQRLGLNIPVEDWRSRILSYGLAEWPVSGDIGIHANRLQDFHSDPADRIITATAALKGATLLTSDRSILSWSGPVQRQDAKA